MQTYTMQWYNYFSHQHSYGQISKYKKCSSHSYPKLVPGEINSPIQGKIQVSERQISSY